MDLTLESVQDEIRECDLSSKVSQQYFPVVLFIMLYNKLVLTFEPMDEILKCDHSYEISCARHICNALNILGGLGQLFQFLKMCLKNLRKKKF